MESSQFTILLFQSECITRKSIWIWIQMRVWIRIESDDAIHSFVGIHIKNLFIDHFIWIATILAP